MLETMIQKLGNGVGGLRLGGVGLLGEWVPLWQP